MKIMKIVEIHTRKHEKHENQRIPCKNNENHETHKNQLENNVNHENLRIS